MPIERGTRVGPYEIVMRLGIGGMGEIFRAHDPRLGRDVAIKVLREEAAKDREGLRRFLSEAKAASALNHPNILTVHEVGESDFGPYIVTELVEGDTVRSMIMQEPLPLGRAIEVAIQAGEGIAKAHEAGIVHRDIKPENLMVTRDSFIKILDFGLAKLVRRGDSSSADQSLTASGTIIGTAGYLSPEQLRGARADARSDVFALTVVLYEMVTGENPFRRNSAVDTFGAILRDDPPPLSERIVGVPEELTAFVRRGLAKKPEDRFPTARVFVAELKKIRTGLESSVSATRIGLPAPPRKPSSRRFLLAAGAAAVAAALAYLLLRRAPLPAPPAGLPASQLAVAVVPIQNQSGDADLEKAGIGKILSDALVQILSDVPSLYVVSPLRLDGVAQSLGHPLTYAAKDPAFAQKVCKKAGATAMLTGSLSRLGQTYVLSANLTELPSERLRGTFRAETGGSERLLQDLTEKLSGSLRTQLGHPAGPAEKPNIEMVATGSIEAYAHLIRGKDFSAEGNWKEAIPEFEKALQLDTKMAVAWSELGCAYSFFGDDAKAQAAENRAEQLVEHANRKEKRWIQWNSIWIKTGKGNEYCAEGERFIRDFPDDREGYFYTGLGKEYLLNDCRGAVDYYEKAYALTPNYYPITKAIVDCRLKLKQREKALATLRRYLALSWVAPHGRQQAQWRLEGLTKG